MALSILKRKIFPAGLSVYILLYRFLSSMLLILVLTGCYSSHDSDRHYAKIDLSNSEYFDNSEIAIIPIPEIVESDSEKIMLGKALFHETRLSKNNRISCASCHNLEKGGTDNLPQSRGINGAIGSVNAPTVLNSGFNFVQFWDGRAATLEEQAAGPVHNPLEMGSDWNEVIDKLSTDKWYVDQFEKLYNDGLTNANIQNAIAIYERALVTPNSPFDRYLQGDNTAISNDAKAGYRLFNVYGCISCHQGINIGGNLFQRLGLMDDYFRKRGNITKEDYGRYNVTGLESDRFKFKVPGLRNVALTSPYFHDGSVETLHEAVEIMVNYQLGKTINEKQINHIVAFLESLTGEIDPALK